MSDLKGLLQTQAEEIAKLSLVGVDTESITNEQIDGIARAIAPEIIRGFAQGIKSELVSTLKDAIKLGISNQNSTDFSGSNKTKGTNNRPVKLNTKESSKLLNNSEKHTELFKGQLGFLESISNAVNKKIEPVKEKPTEKSSKKNDTVYKPTDGSSKPSNFSEIGDLFKNKMFDITGINAVKRKSNEIRGGIKSKMVDSTAWLLGVDEKSNNKRDRHKKAIELKSFLNDRRKENHKNENTRNQQENHFNRINPNWTPEPKKERVSMSQILSKTDKEETVEDNREEEAQTNLMKKIEENTRLSKSSNTQQLGRNNQNQEPSITDSLMNLILGRGKGGKGGVPKGGMPKGVPVTSKWGKGLGVASKLAVPLMVAGAGFNLYSDTNGIDDAVKNGEMTEKQATNKKGGAWGKAIGSVGGALGGAAAGAAIGSVVPVFGTAIGGIIGGVLGSMAGSSGGELLGESVTKYITGGDDVAEKLNPANYNNSGEVVYEKSFDDSMHTSNTSSNLNQVIAPTNNINTSNNTTVMSSPVRNIEPSISEYFRSRYA